MRSRPPSPSFRPTRRVLAGLGLGFGLAIAGLGPQARAETPAPAAAAPAPAAACPALLQHSFPRLQDGQPQPLCQYAGKVLLVVNTASYCGYTRQFEGLEALNAKFAPRGLVVLGFPSNDFKQEDADAGKTAEVCFNTYGVRFPMFEASPVRGSDANAVFAELIRATGQSPGWNFNKYLVGRDGRPLAHYGSKVEPDGEVLSAAIERALQQR